VSRKSVIEEIIRIIAIMKLKIALLLIPGFAALHAFAGDAGKDIAPAAADSSVFDRGILEFEAGAGYFGSFSTGAPRPTINYQLNDLRLGWMYDSPRHHGFWRGNNEFIFEAFGGPVTDSPGGSYLAGGGILWRYNFIQPGARLIPYTQLGAGALDNDVWTSPHQRILGEGFEFLLTADLGIKYLVNDRWAISLEADYRHISNADIASRNQGLNALGALMQISYFFK
jgi:lipid A 3-O-deacylase